MKSPIRSLFVAMLSLGALLSVGHASAKEPEVYAPLEYNTLRLEPGVAVPLNSPQTDHYHAGVAASLKLDLHITPWVDVFPSVTFTGLSIGDQFTPGNQMGVGWMYGAGVRWGRPHDFDNNKGTDFWSSYAPWVDGQPDYVRTGDLNRFGFQFSAGVYFPTDHDRWLWTGPFIAFQEITDGTAVGGTVGKDNTDARIGVIGWGFELDHVHKREVLPPPEYHADVPEEQPVARQEKLEERPLPEPQVIQINMDVQGIPLVKFAFDSATITPEFREKLDGLAKDILKKNMTVSIDGYASDEGHPWAAEHNRKLSLKRAEAVRDYLVSQGVPSEKLAAHGHGTDDPIADNSTEEGRSMNRRVEASVTFTVTCTSGKDCQ